MFQEDDYEHLVTFNKLFCRKVETGKSDNLMELLDEHNGYYYRGKEWQDSKCHSQPYSRRAKYQRTAESSVRVMAGVAT